MDATERATEHPKDEATQPATRVGVGKNNNLRPWGDGPPPNVERGRDGKLRKKKSPADATLTSREKPASQSRPLSNEVEDDLVAMRGVLCTAAEDDVSYQRVRLRKWLDENTSAFMARLERLAKAAEAKARDALATSRDMGATEEFDEGAERARELYERLMESYEDQKTGPPRAHSDVPGCGFGSHI
jgi:hypothetical protein